jgi:uncharacterized protein
VTVPEPTAEQLDLLLELQATDHRIRKLEHQLDDLPEQRELEASRQRLLTYGEQEDETRLTLERASAAQRRLEREVEVLTQRRDAERSRLYDGTVTNQREMQSLEAEIAATERRVTEHEDELIEVLEQVEELETRLTGLQSDRASEEQHVESLTVDRDEAARGLLAELGELKATRQRQAADLPQDLLQRYEGLAARLGGTGVGELDGNSCTACRLDLSMADVNDLLTGPPLATCPQCSRLLVVPA